MMGYWGWPALVWAGGILILSLAMWPWTTRMCSRLPDRGASLAIPGALFASFWILRLCWLLFRFVPQPGWCWLITGIFAALGWIRHPTFKGSFGTAARMRSGFFWGGALFCMLFAFWVRLRATDPGITHTEQPMDLMWMQAAASSPGPFIRDAWFGNAPSTYYADGHQFLAFLSLLFGQPISIGVNLSQATLFALVGLLAVNCTRLWTGSKTASAFALLLVLGLSTPQGAWDALQADGVGWWCWKASRAFQDGSTEMITEFPFFSFWLGDNHPHVIGLPFLLLGILGALMIRRSRTLELTTLIPAGLALAWAWRINPWQLPTVLALTGLGLLSRSRRPSLSELSSGISGLLIGLSPLITPPSEGGLFQGITFGMAEQTDVIEFMQVFGFLVPGLILVICLLPSHDRFGWGVIALTAGMFFTCNLVRVEDAFQTRMNTVFKVYYQLWILFAILAAIGWAYALKRRGWIRITACITLLFPTLGLSYAARLSGKAMAVSERSLDAHTAMPLAMREVIQQMYPLIQPGDRIAEARGNSYQPTQSFLGTWTRGGTVIGWGGHQSQWRPTTTQPSVDALYEAQAEEELVMAVWDLKVQWVVLGPHERATHTIHPDWKLWMDLHFNRIAEEGSWIIWGPKGHEYLAR